MTQPLRPDPSGKTVSAPGPDRGVAPVQNRVGSVPTQAHHAGLPGSDGRSSQVRTPDQLPVAQGQPLLNSELVAVMSWDATGRIDRANSAFLDLFGYTAQDLAGGAIRLAAIIPDAPASPAFAGPEPDSDGAVPAGTLPGRGLEVRLERSDRRSVWCLVSTRLVASPEAAGSAVLVDISDDRTRAVEMDVLYRALEATANAVIVTDRTGRIEWVNRAFTNATGYTADDAIGRNPRLLQSGLMEPSFYQEMWRTISSGEVWRGEVVNRRRDGSLYVEEMSITPVLQDGTIAHYIAIKQDVSERQRSEATLRASEKRFRDLFEQSLDAIIVTDIDHRILDGNPAVERLFGWTREELVGQSAASLAADIETSEQFVRVLQERSVVRDFEATARTKGGGTIEVQLNAVPRYDDGGRLLGYQAIARDITARKRFEEELQHLAFHDWLTGLPNLALFRDRLEHAVAQADRTAGRIALVYLDLDHFKTLNDTHGHNAGDRAIQQVARRLLACFREEDTVARIGGDEFTVVVERLSGPAQLTQILERLVVSLRPPVHVEGQRFELQASVGAVIHEGSTESASGAGRIAEHMIRQADAAMYQAKRSPGTRFHIFDPAVDQDGSARLRRQQELREAIESDALTTFYQPVIELETESLWGVEVLARWNHPEHGLIGPGEFIPLAEECGLIGRLGEWILQHACQDMAGWIQDGLADDVRLMVNLSARQLEDNELPDRISALLDKAGIEPTQLHLEVTETVAVEHPSRVQALRAIGASVSVDDFGTGYSSLRYLKDLEVDGLKVDMGFVQDMENDVKLAAIVRTIVALGAELGLEVVAEGIETGTQLTMLREMGCRLGQGYLFSRPVDAATFEAELLRRVGRT